MSATLTPTAGKNSNVVNVTRIAIVPLIIHTAIVAVIVRSA